MRKTAIEAYFLAWAVGLGMLGLFIMTGWGTSRKAELQDIYCGAPGNPLFFVKKAEIVPYRGAYLVTYNGKKYQVSGNCIVADNIDLKVAPEGPK